ncbi:DNA-directed RNA polymerase II subunit RPB1 [Biomphalaria glabrata]|uniref:Uncharacterized protein LOC106054630 isoform X1 n=1 Tax=Biomphalaria glabrata TaxID=6526 RepID=A0A9U8DYU8_BIOGL|nr:uncharacterized protein LOC106054630 isoform X1 [Biomphalaria glabrata]KAI8756484.1 DNA-directed RNA polymerase II subunit RPB1-like [Biomphalaria glabrata]KAI8797890.1 DNA-directed RNA polymerase II subunit RPB1 [Biomphalaria glabrata]
MDTNYGRNDKKLGMTGNTAIASVAASLYNSSNRNSFTHGENLTPKANCNLYTWGKISNDETRFFGSGEKYSPSTGFSSNAATHSTSPGFISRGGFSPPFFGVKDSPYAVHHKNQYMNTLSPESESSIYQGSHFMTPNHNTGNISSTTTPVPGVQRSPCYCQKSPKMILCKTCGETFTGRVRAVCPAHPKKIFLMDIECCIVCQSENLKELCDA